MNKLNNVLVGAVFAITLALPQAHAGSYTTELECARGALAVGSGPYLKEKMAIIPTTYLGKKGLYIINESTAYFMALPEEYVAKISRLAELRLQVPQLRKNAKSTLDNWMRFPTNLKSNFTWEIYKNASEKRVEADAEIDKLKQYELPGVVFRARLPDERNVEFVYKVFSLSSGTIIYTTSMEDEKNVVATYDDVPALEAQDGRGRERMEIKNDIVRALRMYHDVYKSIVSKDPSFDTSKNRKSWAEQIKICKNLKDPVINAVIETEMLKLNTGKSYTGTSETRDGSSAR